MVTSFLNATIIREYNDSDKSQDLPQYALSKLKPTRASNSHELLKQLSTIFTSSVLQRVLHNLNYTENSWLGGSLSFLKGVRSVARDILYPTDTTTIPEKSDNNDGWQQVIPKQYRRIFKQLRIYKVTLPKRDTLAEMSYEVSQYSVFDRMKYYPRARPRHRVNLYHGTHAGSIDSFKHCGIAPLKAGTEYSTEKAFYVTNDARAAYEIPYHSHLGADDDVVLYRFTVDVAIIHGERPYDGEHDKYFKVKWFNGSSPEWKSFVANNLYSEDENCHDYDLVIGPLGWPNAHGTVKCRSSPGSEIVQIAFCSKEARSYLTKCVNQLFVFATQSSS